MGTGRDDFTKDTIRRAAGRVGYRCSFPGCPNATVGASMESTSKVSITGVAAHICAAAKGGPRYDENMTTNERSGIDNCIWLCQTHSKLIDTDEKTYTVELLREWKSDAENAASKSLADGDYFAVYYKSNGDNLSILGQFFDDMISNGQFEQLNTMLGQYKTTLSEQYEEFVLRYKIIFDTYCSRGSLGVHLKSYCDLPCKTGADVLAELFLSFHIIDSLKIIVDYCTAQHIKEYAYLAISGTLIEQLVVPVGSTAAISIPADLSNAISKYITNYIRENRIIGTIDVSGKAYSLYSDEFYYRAVSAAHELAYAEIYGAANFDETIKSPDFIFIRNNLDKIKFLEGSLQKYIWEQFLLFLSMDYALFRSYYPQCPLSLIDCFPIQKAKHICQIKYDVNTVNIDDLMRFSNMSGDDSVICMYLSFLSKDDANEFLDQHGYLYRKSSAFLKLKLYLINDISDDALVFLEKYKTEFQDDFLFHCLLAKYSLSDQKQNDELEWLKKNKSKLKIHGITDYIHILRNHKQWRDLVELSEFRLPNEYAFCIAGYLSESGDDEFVKISQTIYQTLLTKGWERKGLYFNIGLIQNYFGYIAEAKTSFRNEYDRFHTVSALKYLFQIRYETHEYITDDYFEKLKTCVDAQSQNLVGAICMKLRIYNDARKYFLRSLLIDDKDNVSINGFWQTVSQLPQELADTIKANTVCILKNDHCTCQVAIHASNIIDGIISPSGLADCSHYSIEDAQIADLLFHTQGESVSFGEDTYTVEAILTVNNTIVKFFFSTLSTKEGVLAIHSSSPEEFWDIITPMLKSSSENLDKQIREYNQQEVRYPLTVLSAITEKGMLSTCEFLAFGNQERIRNNLSLLEQSDTSTAFVLSYDAIVFLTHIGIDSNELHYIDVLCAPQVKNQLINDINEELSSLSDENQKASMVFNEGKIALFERTSDFRRDRYSFLTRLKSFVNGIRTKEDSFDFTSCNTKLKNELDQLFLKQKLYCEGGSLSVAKSTPNGVLVTDDQFLYALANTEGISNIGLVGFLTNANLNWRKLLRASKQLEHINFGNYLPLQLYKQIVDQLIESEDNPEPASIEIQKWLMSNTDSVPTIYHEDIISILFHDIYSLGLDYLNPNNILGKLAIGVLEKRNPGFIQKCISDAMKSLREIAKE